MLSHTARLDYLAGALCVLSLGNGPNGSILVVSIDGEPGSKLVIVNSQLVTLESSYRCPMILPNGDAIVEGQPIVASTLPPPDPSSSSTG